MQFVTCLNENIHENSVEKILKNVNCSYCTRREKIGISNNLNLYPRILEIKCKTRDRDRACFAEKIQSAALRHLYMFLCFGFFPEMTLGDGPKNSRVRVKCTKIGISPVIRFSNRKLVKIV